MKIAINNERALVQSRVIFICNEITKSDEIFQYRYFSFESYRKLVSVFYLSATKLARIFARVHFQLAFVQILRKQ